jgi:hypothetical protein
MCVTITKMSQLQTRSQKGRFENTFAMISLESLMQFYVKKTLSQMGRD